MNASNKNNHTVSLHKQKCRKIYGIFLLSLVGIFSSNLLFAQRILALKNEKITLQPKDYYIAKVIDSRKATGNIGVVINENGQSATINLAGGVERTVSTYFQRNLTQSKNNYPVLFKIKELSLFETKKSDGRVEGKCQLIVEFDRVLDGDTIKVSEAKSANNFIRTANNVDDGNYDRIIRDRLVSSLTYLNQWLDKNEERSEAFAKGSRVILLPDADKSDEDTLYFSFKRPLNWHDFQAKPPSNTHYAAAVFPTIGFDASFRVVGGYIEAQVRPKAFVVRGMSWVKDNNRNDYALAHEQVHFNIVKIVLEHFKKKIQTLKAETIDLLNSQIQYEYLESFREMNKMQDAYDGETNHGLNEYQQQKWAERVAKEL